MRWSQPTGEEALPAPTPARPQNLPGEAFTRRFVTTDAILVLLLAFLFGFGNGWHTALRLGVNRWIAPLSQPAVDLAVVGLMTGIRYLAIHGWTSAQLRMPRWWLRCFGLMALAMNVALPLSGKFWGRAAWDAIGPILLIAWSELGPWLLRAIYSIRADLAAQAAVVEPDPEPDLLPLPEEPVEAPAETPEEETPEPPARSTPPATVLHLTGRHPRGVDLVALAEQFMLDHDAKGKCYREGLIPQLDKLVQQSGLKVTRRRVGQVCQEGWDRLYDEGRVSTSRTA